MLSGGPVARPMPLPVSLPVSLPDGAGIDRPHWMLAGPATVLPAGRPWDLIEDSLAAAPARTRLVAGELRLSGAELLDGVARLGSLPLGGRVGVHVARSACLVQLVLAIWARGGTYVPLATEHPAARLAAIAESCGLDTVLTGDGAAAFPLHRPVETLSVRGREVRVLARIAAPAAGAEAVRNGARPCYVAHTSGSSGAPKGVSVGDAALLNRLVAMRDLADPTGADIVLFKTSLAFDVHVWEFAFPLAFGCVLAVYEQGRHFDPRALARLIVERRVTIAGFVPSLLALLVDRDELVRDNALRLVFCGGENWPASLGARFLAAFPRAVLRNSYGPAETTLAVCNGRATGDATREVELGAPLANTLFLVEERARAGARVTGALHVGGMQVALGYVRPPAGASPFRSARIDGVETRLYATGDLVELDTGTGALWFRGRDDDEIKLDGVRISLAEIEAVIGRLPDIEACAAAVLAAPGGAILCGTYKLRPGAGVTAGAIRDACLAVLPATHVPTRWREVEAYELDLAGKVSRARLAERLARSG